MHSPGEIFSDGCGLVFVAALMVLVVVCLCCCSGLGQCFMYSNWAVVEGDRNGLASNNLKDVFAVSVPILTTY